MGGSKTDQFKEWSSKERHGFRNLKREVKVGLQCDPTLWHRVMCAGDKAEVEITL